LGYKPAARTRGRQTPPNTFVTGAVIQKSPGGPESDPAKAPEKDRPHPYRAIWNRCRGGVCLSALLAAFRKAGEGEKALTNGGALRPYFHGTTDITQQMRGGNNQRMEAKTGPGWRGVVPT